MVGGGDGGRVEVRVLEVAAADTLLLRIEDFIRGFFGAIGGISHQFENCWTLGERAFANGFVTYVR